MKHILSVAAIVKQIKKNKDVANLYEKVNQVLKGAVTGTPELVEEIKEIVSSNAKNLAVTLSATKKKLEEAKIVEEEVPVVS